MTKSAPLVSVCIPVHNCAAYIDQAIESVLAQTMSDWELVILDNASSDGTAAIARSYIDHRIRIVENSQNLGLEANWNKALQASRGEYIKLLPADDYLLPRCLETQVAALALEVSRKAVLTCCGRRIISPAGDTLLTRRFSRRDGYSPGSAAIRKIVRSGTNLLGEPGAILFRRDVLQLTGPFSASLLYVIDVDLWMRILLCGDLFTLAEPLCAFRLSAGSNSVELAALHSHHFSSFIWKLYADPRYSVHRLDAYQGILMSQLLSWARRLVYLFTLRSAPVVEDGKAR